ncbi:MAG: hypothetical protein K1X33_06690 [Methanobacteriaceae archaeon]|nr:hypothetical protein [Methanobacteriaceae archaeon]
MELPYDEKEHEKNIERKLDKIIKNSNMKVSQSEKDVYKLIDQFEIKHDKILDKRLENEDSKIDKYYEKLRKEAKY